MAPPPKKSKPTASSSQTHRPYADFAFDAAVLAAESEPKPVQDATNSAPQVPAEETALVANSTPIKDEPVPIHTNPSPVPSASPSQHSANPSIHGWVEKSLSVTRTRYSEAKKTVEDTSIVLQVSLNTAQQAAVALGVKSLQAVQAGAQAHLDFLKALTSAKSFSDVVTLQSDFARRQLQEASQRTRELVEIAQKAARDTAAPVKDHVSKTLQKR